MATRTGFAQVELNHVSGYVEGHVYAQYPVYNERTAEGAFKSGSLGDVIEQGRFAKYDGVTNKVNLTGSGEWLMIYNEEKLPDPRKQAHKDYAMQAQYTVGGETEMYPRLIEICVGDIFTTNAIDASFTAATVSALTDTAETTITIPAVGTKLYVGANGYLTATQPSSYVGPVFEAIKTFVGTATMPDGQAAVKLMRIS